MKDQYKDIIHNALKIRADTVPWIKYIGTESKWMREHTHGWYEIEEICIAMAESLGETNEIDQINQ